MNPDQKIAASLTQMNTQLIKHQLANKAAASPQSTVKIFNQLCRDVAKPTIKILSSIDARVDVFACIAEHSFLVLQNKINQWRTQHPKEISSNKEQSIIIPSSHKP